MASLIIMVAVNLLSVKVFGEFEFWFSLIKVVTIIGLIITGLGLIVFGIGNGGEPLGISNLWAHGGFMPHGIFGVMMAFQMVTFAYGGIEIIGLTAGEAKNPKVTIQRAIRSVPWRILLFYVGAIFVILSIYPWNAEGQGSPFVSTFESLGIKSAAGLINFVVITAALSSCNGGIYSTGRMLMNLTYQKQAPQFFGKTTANGVPRRALILKLIMLFIGVLLNYLAPAKVFIWLTAVAATGNITTWILILLAQIRFRRSLSKAEVARCEFRMPGWPLTSYAALAFMIFVLGIMAWVEDTRLGVIAGGMWLTYLADIYWAVYRKKKHGVVQPDPLNNSE